MIVTVITRHNVKLTPVQTPAWNSRHSGNIGPFEFEMEAEIPSGNASRIWNQLILRAVGRPQCIAYGQRLCLEFRERVVAALGSRIHCENHALTTVAGRSICSLATMDPDGFRLMGSERTVSSII